MTTARPIDGALEMITALTRARIAERASHDQTRAELDQVRAVLASLWPAADDGSTVELAHLAADTITRQRGEPDTEAPTGTPRPGWRRRLAAALGLIALAAIGGLAAGITILELTR